MLVLTVAAVMISKNVVNKPHFMKKTMKYVIIPFLISTMFFSACLSAVEYTYSTVINNVQ